MKLPVQVEPCAGTPPGVDYRWDPDTDILSARVRAHDEELALAIVTAIPTPRIAEPDAPVEMFAAIGVEPPLSGAVEVEGRDGSWLVLDVEAGHLAGIEVAVWPNVRKREALALPVVIEDARVRVTARRRPSRDQGPVNYEVTTRVTAEADAAERTIHFRLGPPRLARSVRLGRDLLVDVDAEGHLAGVWLLNVPPVPTVT